MLYRRYNSANTFQEKTEAQTNREPPKPPHGSGNASQMPHGGINQAARHSDTYGTSGASGANSANGAYGAYGGANSASGAYGAYGACGGANQAARHSDTYSAYGAYGGASQMPHGGINSGEIRHQDKSSFPHFEHTNSQNYGQTPKNAPPQSGSRQNPPHREPPQSGCHANPPHNEPPQSGSHASPPHGGKKSLDIGKMIEGFIPSALYNPQTKKFLGLIGAEDLLLLALIFLIMENDREKDPTLLIALVYILASEYIDLPDLTF